MLTGHERLLILEPSLSDGGNLTGSAPAGSTVGLTNLQDPRPRAVYVTEEVATAHVKLQAFGTVAWNAVWGGYWNLGDADGVRLRAAATEAGLTDGSATVDESFLPVPGPVAQGHRNDREWLHWLLWLGDADVRTEPWIRVDFTVTNPRLPAGYAGPDFLSGGRLMAGKAYRPPFHYRLGSSHDPASERVEEVEAFDGEVVRRRRGKKKSVTLTASWIPYDQVMDQVDELGRVRGGDGDVLVVLDPEATRLDRRIYHGAVIELTYREEAKAALGTEAVPEAEGTVLYAVTFTVSQEVAY